MKKGKDLYYQKWNLTELASKRAKKGGEIFIKISVS